MIVCTPHGRLNLSPEGKHAHPSVDNNRACLDISTLHYALKAREGR